MTKKTYEGTGTLPGMDAEARLAARPRVRSAPPPPREIPLARIVVFAIGAACILLVSLYGFHRFEQFLIRDPRFALNGPEGSWDTATLEITGAAHASRSQLEAIFAEDAGRSVYLLTLAERRESLRSVSWVRDASIARMWPNRVMVNISERAPVAFVTLAPSRLGLIDEDGVILPAPADRFKLPMLVGVHGSDAVEERRKRVHRMLRLTRDLGDAAANISQIDVSDPDNLKITEPWDGRVLTLMMGDHGFALRYANFVRNYSEIKQNVPRATTLDLRLEDRITAVE